MWDREGGPVEAQRPMAALSFSLEVHEGTGLALDSLSQRGKAQLFIILLGKDNEAHPPGDTLGILSWKPVGDASLLSIQVPIKDLLLVFVPLCCC